MDRNGVGARKTVADINGRRERFAPAIFAALLDAMSAALDNLSTTQLSRLPRMADACLWVTAAEHELPWAVGTFAHHFEAIQNKATADAVEASPVGSTLLEIMERRLPMTEWIIAPTRLYEELSMAGGVKTKMSWPKSPRGLLDALNRLAPALRKMGLTFTKRETHNREYVFHYDHSCSIEKKALDTHCSPQAMVDAGEDMGASEAEMPFWAHQKSSWGVCEKDAHTTSPKNREVSGVVGGSGAPYGVLHFEGDRI